MNILHKGMADHEYFSWRAWKDVGHWEFLWQETMATQQLTTDLYGAFYNHEWITLEEAFPFNIRTVCGVMLAAPRMRTYPDALKMTDQLIKMGPPIIRTEHNTQYERARIHGLQIVFPYVQSLADHKQTQVDHLRALWIISEHIMGENND